MTFREWIQDSWLGEIRALLKDAHLDLGVLKLRSYTGELKTNTLPCKYLLQTKNLFATE